MTPHDMLDYALGQIDDGHRERIEQQVAADGALGGSLERLRQNLGLLLDDGADPLPPADLVRRTILRVEVERRGRAVLEYVPSQTRFRWTDLAVAAGIFIAGLLTLLPAMQRSQLAARSAACVGNLQELGVGLIRYATAHNRFPSASPESPTPYAGTFAIDLKESGILDDATLLNCPSNGRDRIPGQLPCYAELHAMERRSPRSAPCLKHSDYAYTLGYSVDGSPAPLPARLPGDYPLLADKPPHDAAGHALAGNSHNHGGAGQYVLFVGGHTRFLPTRRLGPDSDLFLNDRFRTAPGLGISDYVLAPGISRVDGR